MKTYTETIKKLTNLPNWTEVHRRELAVELRPELAAVTNVFGREQLKRLAKELPVWARTFAHDTLDREALSVDLLALIGVADYFTINQKVALQLLLLDVRTGTSVAERTLNNNYRISVQPC